MTTTAAVRPSHAGWLFEDGTHQPLTPALLTSAGLAWEPFAGARISVARAGRARTWHLAPPAAGPPNPAGPCSCLRRAAARGRVVEARHAGILDGLRLCRWCATALRLPGPEGAYLALARHVIATTEWVQALEHAAPSASWLDYARWTARTPFTSPATLPALLAALPPSRAWKPCRDAAEKAWQQLTARADAAWAHARQTVGPPGLRAMAAAAAALAGKDRRTRAESQLIAAITTGPPWLAHHRDAWQMASSAWLDAIAPDADPDTARTALHTAIEHKYAESPVRDVTLLPDPATTLPGDHDSPADWARAEYQALRQQIAAHWCLRLETTLADISHADHPWRLVLVAGWPLTDDRDRELAYLASYPELGRTPDPGCGTTCGRAHPSWAVVLHLPGFAARHAAAHDSPHLHVTTGPALPAGATPDPAQVHALLRQPCDLDDNPAAPETQLAENAPRRSTRRRVGGVPP